MPFITQGKTNLAYILIVVVLAVIVGGGILAYQYWYLSKEETKPKEFPYQISVKKTVNIKVTNSVTNQPIAGAKITIESYHNCSPAQVIGNECVPELWNLETNFNGEVIFDKLGAPLNIQVTAEKNGFQTIAEQMIDDEFTIKESSAELLLSLPPEEDTEDETADWKIYQNLNGGFQINYPPEMTVKVEESGQDLLPFGEFNEIISFLFPDDIKTGVAGIGIENAVNIEDPRMTYPTLQVTDPKLQAEFIQTFLYPDCCNEEREIFFGGKVGYKLEFKTEQTHPYYKIFIIFIFGRDQKSLLAIAGTTNNEQQSQIVDKMLATFKFLD